MNQLIELEEIYSPVGSLMERIPQTILQIVSTPNDFAREIVEYFFSGRGKLLRPALTILGSEIIGSPAGINGHENGFENRLLRLAASYEIFHAATLIHDDIIDSAYLRRNLPTVNVKWGPQTAVLLGDYLHERAIHTILKSGSEVFLRRFLETAHDVCDGEIREIKAKGNTALSEGDYFEIIEKKTAALLVCALESGALLAGAGIAELEALKSYGRFFGMAFQIVDDCLDFQAKEHEFGKTLGADCAAGILTLPVIRLLKVSDPGRREQIAAFFKAGIGAGEFQQIVEWLGQSDAIGYCLDCARGFSDRARLELDLFPDSPVKRSLHKLLDYVLERNR